MSNAKSMTSQALAVIQGRTQIRDIPKRVRKMSKLASRKGLEIDSARPRETVIAIDMFLAESLDDDTVSDEGRNHLIFALGLIAGQCYLDHFGGEWRRDGDKIVADVKSPVTQKRETVDIIGMALLRSRQKPTQYRHGWHDLSECFKNWEKSRVRQSDTLDSMR